MVRLKHTINTKDKTYGKEVFIKRLLFISVFVFFLILLIQQNFHVVKKYKVEKLDGYFEPKLLLSFSAQTWFDNTYQNATEDYLHENFGFRNLFVRLNNQIKFLFFNKTNARDVFVGKENYLYDVNYINTYNAFEYSGDKAISDTISRLKFLQDTLKLMGKNLLVVLAPSKARIYPEYIPEGYLHPSSYKSYYNAYSEEFKKSGINCIDFNHLFLTKKTQSEYLLIPQLGIHWSRLEAVRAADTIIKYFSFLSSDNLPQIQIQNINEKNQLESPDDDIVKSMNLLFYPKYKKMAYPEFSFNTHDKVKKNLLVVSDSYWWDIYLQNIPKNVFANNDFWYYYKDAWGNNYLGKKSIQESDVKRSLLQNDYILIMISESNLDKMGFGFIGSAINSIKREIYPTKEELDLIIEKILNNSDWIKQIFEKATNRNIPFDSLLVQDAQWYFQRNGPAVSGISLDDLQKSIRNNTDWMNAIKAKIPTKNLSLDSLVNLEAISFMQESLKLNPFVKNPERKNYRLMIEKIKSNPEWHLKVKNKAALQNVDIELMLILDAVWQIEQETRQNNDLGMPKTFPEVVKHIKNTPEWLNQIKLKANKRGVSVDSMITLDALWYMKENHLK